MSFNQEIGGINAKLKNRNVDYTVIVDALTRLKVNRM